MRASSNPDRDWNESPHSLRPGSSPFAGTVPPNECRSCPRWTSLVQLNWQGRSLMDLALASPTGRTLSQSVPEKPAQMGLIRKSDAQRYVAQRQGAGYHQMAGLLQPPLDDVGMRRFSEGQLERPREMRRPPPRHAPQILGVNVTMQFLVEKSGPPRYLPSHQPCRSGAPRTRMAFDL